MAVAKALYSTSVDDLEMVDCLFEAHIMGLLPIQTHTLTVNFLLKGSPAQSASSYVFNNKGPNVYFNDK